MKKILPILLIFVLVISGSGLSAIEIEKKESSDDDYIYDLDIYVRGGLGGLVVTIRNKGPDYFNHEASISILGARLFNDEIKILLLIPVIENNERIVLRSSESHFLFGFNLISFEIKLYIGEDEDYDKRITRRALLVGPFVIMIPAKLK